MFDFHSKNFPIATGQPRVFFRQRPDFFQRQSFQRVANRPQLFSGHQQRRVLKLYFHQVIFVFVPQANPCGGTWMGLKSKPTSVAAKGSDTFTVTANFGTRIFSLSDTFNDDADTASVYGNVTSYSVSAVPNVMATDLFPSVFSSGVSGATIYAMSANQLAGPCNSSASTSATIWSEAAGSVVLLRNYANVFGTTGTNQVGEYTLTIGGNPLAAMWSGSAASYVDLHSWGVQYSVVQATTGTAQAGFVGSNNIDHVALWFGAAASFVDLQASLSASQAVVSESSADLAAWTPVQTNNTALSSLTITNAYSSGVPRRFFVSMRSEIADNDNLSMSVF